jgi:hypothetical protein
MTLRIGFIDQSEKLEWSKLFQSYADFYQVDLPPQAEKQAWSWIHDSKEDFWCDVAITEDSFCTVFLYGLKLILRSSSALP